METIFNTLINSYIDNKVGITDNFLNASLAAGLKGNLVTFYNEKRLLAAGTGKGSSIERNKSVRGDMIYWLDQQRNNLHEQEFFKLMDAFVRHLNATCYTGITGYEFHYTLYEEGSFYIKHIDQLRNNDSRQYSRIIYLNEGWNECDGGELCIHHDDKVLKIAPVNGKSVFFKSSTLAHEVLCTHKPRMSITGWLKDKLSQISNLNFCSD